MHNREIKKVLIQNKIIKFKEEAINGDIKKFDRHVEVHKIDKTNATVNAIFYLVKSVRKFKKRIEKCTSIGIRQMLLI